MLAQPFLGKLVTFRGVHLPGPARERPERFPAGPLKKELPWLTPDARRGTKATGCNNDLRMVPYEPRIERNSGEQDHRDKWNPPSASGEQTGEQPASERRDDQNRNR